MDGKAHSVDSSDAAFQTAGALALREAGGGVRDGAARTARRGGRDGSPTSTSAPVLGDLSGRRGRVLGTDVGGPGAHRGARRGAVHRAVRYAVDLRAMTSGAATFTRRRARYEVAPSG